MLAMEALLTVTAHPVCWSGYCCDNAKDKYVCASIITTNQMLCAQYLYIV